MRNLITTVQSALALGAVCLLTTVPPGPASAQTAKGKTDCVTPGPKAGAKAEPGTAPDRTSADGTAPGNSGSTGWTGGTGGAYIGTNPQGATAPSTTWQPPTARGLDLAMAPKAAETGC